MKYQVFDVVELKNRNKATILEVVNNNTYKVEIVNCDGISQGILKINENDVNKIIIKK